MRLPILGQVVVLLAISLLAVQMMTVLMLGLMPPERASVYRASDLAEAFRGRGRPPGFGRPLVRTVQATPPRPVRGQADNLGARRVLAALLGTSPARVRVVVQSPRGRGGLLGFRLRVFGPGLRNAGPMRMNEQPPFFEGPGPRDPQGPWPGPPLFPGRIRTVMGDFAVVGDVVAAYQLPDGRWSVLRPQPEPFPTASQRWIGLWLLGCILLVAPAAYLFARRMTAPIHGFARAAEALGRDPHAAPMETGGPAEIEKAAHAFNLMQIRLQRFIEDRTAMIGAISHDLRTPLSRIRFRMERDPAGAREAILADLAQMEEMIASVLEFIRDAGAPGRRQRLELRSLVECVVDAATLRSHVDIEDGPALYVHGDSLALTRLFSNLVDNGAKYGTHVEVRLFAAGGDAVAEIHDDGPGIPPDDLQRVFTPFYRADAARNLDAGGVGLGLSVARTIARAHGGEVALDQQPAAGLKAVVRLPLDPALHG